MVGGLLGLCGSLWLDAPTRLPVFIALAVGGAFDVVGHQLPLGRNHETSYRSSQSSQLWLLSRNAAVLATGFATRVGLVSLYALAVSIVLLSSTSMGLLVWGTYGLVRTGSVGLTARIMRRWSPLELFSYRKRVVRTSGALTIVCSSVTLVI